MMEPIHAACQIEGAVAKINDDFSQQRRRIECGMERGTEPSEVISAANNRRSRGTKEGKNWNENTAVSFRTRWKSSAKRKTHKTVHWNSAWKGMPPLSLIFVCVPVFSGQEISPVVYLRSFRPGLHSQRVWWYHGCGEHRGRCLWGLEILQWLKFDSGVNNTVSSTVRSC